MTALIVKTEEQDHVIRGKGRRLEEGGLATGRAPFGDMERWLETVILIKTQWLTGQPGGWGFVTTLPDELSRAWGKERVCPGSQPVQLCADAGETAGRPGFHLPQHEKPRLLLGL